MRGRERARVVTSSMQVRGRTPMTTWSIHACGRTLMTTWSMRARRHALALIVTIVAVCVSALPARASDEKQCTIADVTVVARYVWSESAGKGYLPFSFEIANDSGERRSVEITLHPMWYMSQSEAFDEIELDPGERRSIELFAPALMPNPGPYNVRVIVDGVEETLPDIGVSSYKHVLVRNVLHVSEQENVAGPAVWSSDLSAREPSNAFALNTSEQRRVSIALHGATAAGWSVEVTPITFAQMPLRYEPYSSVDAVAIDCSSGLPPLERLEPLLAWARLGGCVSFHGKHASAAARSVADVARWLEPRFRLEPFEDAEVHAMGHGVVVIAESDEPFGSQAQRDAFVWALEHPLAWVPHLGRDNTKSFALPIAGLELPYRALTLLLVLFAIVIGPLNFHYVRKKGRPGLLLLTVPVIALVFSIGLFVYGALSQGLGLRATSVSLTVLDQRDHRADCAEVRTLFAGLPVSAGLAPGQGTSCYMPLERNLRAGARDLVLDFTEGLVLRGEYLPVRTPIEQRVLVDRTSRVRLEFTPQGDSYHVENGLTTTVESLVFCDARGDLHVSDGRLDSGASQTLRRIPADAALAETAAEATGLADARWPIALWPNGSRIPSTYAAISLSSPFVDKCGLEYEDEASRHELLGILDDDLAARAESPR